ncbi:MAG TPA: HNH endonuclease [Pelobium sp.]|nr:HNH endonuclease [Pelobium sp.]
MQQQNYEYYWKLTNAFTEYTIDSLFFKTLKICVEFIDKNKEEVYSKEKYKKLQNDINKVLPKHETSIRKSINQLVKMGFIQPFLISYHPLAKDFLNSKSNKKAETLLSKIVYSNASLNRAVKNESNLKELNFLIKSLIEYGRLSKEEIIGLMLVDLKEYKREFISKEDLNEFKEYAIEINFHKRKYNQIGYFCNLLSKLDNLTFVKGDLYFTEDAERIFGEDLNGITKRRDPYLHRLYKNQLQEECEELYGNPICVLEKLKYPVLIASHIKPFIESNEIEAYDPNNGLLLSRTIDTLFDLKYISFTNEGKIIFSKRLSNDVVEFWKNYRLDEHILNEQRLKYLEYHRQLLIKIDAVA